MNESKMNPIIPWIEKYRPNNLSEIVFHDDLVSLLIKSTKTKELPNLLFYGPPGTGKTSSVLALSRELFGSEFSDRILELNASDERGIQVIREKVKLFARISVPKDKRNSNGDMIPPFKIIILDEVDSMTSSAQAALRRLMEHETTFTRFCLICNYLTKIIPPLISRCTKFRFKSITHDVILDKLKRICRSESILIDENAIIHIARISNGDLRKSISILQSSYRFSGNNNVQLKHVTEASGAIPIDYSIDLFNKIVNCSPNICNLVEVTQDFFSTGYSPFLLIDQFINFIIDHECSDLIKAAIFLRCSEICKNLVDGSDNFIQILALFSCISNKMRNE